MAQKTYEAVVLTVKKYKHHIRIKARTGNAAITKLVKQMGKEEVYEIRVKETKNV